MFLIAESQELYCNFDVYLQADDWIYIKWGGQLVLLPHSCFLSFPPQVNARSEFTIQKSKWLCGKNTHLANKPRMGLKQEMFVKIWVRFFSSLSPSVFFEAADTRFEFLCI